MDTLQRELEGVEQVAEVDWGRVGLDCCPDVLDLVDKMPPLGSKSLCHAGSCSEPALVIPVGHVTALGELVGGGNDVWL